MSHEIRLHVVDKQVTASTDGTRLVGGTVRHYTASASFDAEWEGLAVRVTWVNGAKSVTQDWRDGMEVPWEVTAEGPMRVGFAGVGADGVEVVRTARMARPILWETPAADMGDEATEATEDVAHAARRELDGLTAEVADVRAALDRGELKGEKGDKGDKGDTGATGPQGPAGKDADIAAAQAATQAATQAASTADAAAASATEAAGKADSNASRADTAASSASKAAESASAAAADAKDAAGTCRAIYFKRATDADGNTRPVLVDTTI